jgi:hypothetical protein
MIHKHRLAIAALALAALLPLAAHAAEAPLLPVQANPSDGKILLTLPPAGADGVAGRYILATALRTGLGSAPTFLDRGRAGQSQLLLFRRIGKKVAIEYQNPRFRPSPGSGDRDFATSIVWMGDAQTLPDGRLVIDIGSFLTSDVLGIADSLNQRGAAIVAGEEVGAGKGFHLVPALSAADPGAVKVFPDNIELEAIQTYGSESPGAEVANIAPDPRQVSFTVHFSLVRLPAPGFVPRRFDPRIGGFATQIVDNQTPLGRDPVQDYANRFRLEKTDPTAARSPVKKPIVFYIDRNAPPQVKAALVEGVNWWRAAFDAAGFLDAFRAEPLPDGVDPLDVRYNIVNWVDRATRGWSYGQEIVDPRSGEILKGMVVLGSERMRQDMLIFEGLVGADKLGTGGPNDPIVTTYARLRQLGAHEVGHSLGFAHNFAASTQERASVMDYPAPRIGLVDGRPDLSDAYGVGVGKWDMATVAWLYGAGDQAAADASATAAMAAGLRYVEDDNARNPDTAQPYGGLWDDGADPIVELGRLMQVRRAAIDHFGLNALAPGEAVAELKRRFVPIWLLHRYQLVSAAKAVGGVDFAYAVKGGGHETGAPVDPTRQRAALAAVLATLSPEALRVPPALIPLLTAARNGSDNRQYDIEIMGTAGGPVFDPLVAADVGASLTLSTLLAPTRLQRVVAQHAVDPTALGLDELLDKLLAATLPAKMDAVQERIATRTLVTLGQKARDKSVSPEVAMTIAARLEAVKATLAKRGDAWAKALPRELDRMAGETPRAIALPPGDPIGGGEGEWMDFDLR